MKILGRIIAVFIGFVFIAVVITFFVHSEKTYFKLYDISSSVDFSISLAQMVNYYRSSNALPVKLNDYEDLQRPKSIEENIAYWRYKDKKEYILVYYQKVKEPVFSFKKFQSVGPEKKEEYIESTLYDPTNGAISSGDIVISSEYPNLEKIKDLSKRTNELADKLRKKAQGK